MRGREHRRQAAPLERRKQHRLLGADRVDHRLEIVDLLLQGRRPGDPVGHATPAALEQDQPRERREPLEQEREGRQLPEQLDVRHIGRNEDDVERPFTGHLEGDLQITAVRVTSLRRLHRVTPYPWPLVQLRPVPRLVRLAWLGTSQPAVKRDNSAHFGERIAPHWRTTG